VYKRTAAQHPRPQCPLTHADPASLRALAAKEINPRSALP
jgi:hypothetical protein